MRLLDVIRRSKVCVLALILLAGSGTMQAQVTVSLPNTSSLPAAAVRIPLTVGSLAGLNVTSFEFVVSCDTTVLRFTGVDENGTLSAGFGAVANYSVAPYGPGKMKVSCAGATPLTGSGVLIYVTGTAQSKIGSGSLQLSAFLFNTGTPAANLTNGLVSVTAAILGEYTADANTLLLLHMNEASGTIVGDASSYANNASTSITVPISSFGRFGSARNFDGSQNLILAPSTSIPSSTPFTVEGWVNVDPGFSALNRWAKLFSDGQTWAGVIRFNSFGVYLGGSDALAVSEILTPGQWYHYAIVFDAGTVKMYLNGALRISSAYTLSGSQGQLMIGGQVGTNDFLRGMIDEVRVSNKARTPQEFDLQAPPTSVAASASGNVATISWQNGGGVIGLQRYKVYRGADSITVSLIGSTIKTSYSDSTITSGTRYYYRVSAVDSTGFEAAQSFAATPLTGGLPVTTTGIATNISQSGATLNGTVNPNVYLTTAYFEWGTSSTLASFSSTSAQSIGGGVSTIAVAAGLTGLSPATTYYYRVVGQNSSGTARASIASFTTSAVLPLVVTNAPASVGSTSATFSGIVNPNGTSTTAWFEWGTNGSMQTYDSTAKQAIGSTTTAVTLTATVALKQNTSYFYRAVAQNSAGTVKGSIIGFTSSTVTTLLGEYNSDANTMLLLHMNETSGSSVSDASSYGNSGNATGTAIVDARTGKARTFNGSTDKVVIADNSTLNFSSSQDFTVEAWIKSVTSQTAFHGIVSKAAASPAANKGFQLATYSDKIAGEIADGSTAVGVAQGLVGTTLLNDGRWHHTAFVVSRASKNGSLYVDGRLEVTVTNAVFGNSIGASVPLNVGVDRESINYYAGTIDEVRVSNKARSSNEFNLQLAPKNLAAIVSGTTINLSWQNGGGLAGLLRYRIYGGADSTNVSQIDSTSATSYSNTGLTAGSRYFYRISAVDSTGFEGAKSWSANAQIPIVVPQTPTINSFSPSSGPIGTTVTITGTNFSSTASNNVVCFGAIRAQVSSATSTSLAVTVPAGATYAPITVTVNGYTASSRLPFTVTFVGGGSVTSSSFQSKVDFASTKNPRFVATGDVDGDGKLDLVVANPDSNTVSVFRNAITSGGITVSSFAPKVDFATGSYPWSFAIGDVDGDGKPDLVATNVNSSTISVFRNTSASGSITASSFASKVDFAVTGMFPQCVAIGDLDGDGKPDLVVGDAGAAVSVFRNTGATGNITLSSFAPKVDFPTGSSVWSVAIGDLDGDGKPDFVAANPNSNTISVFRNASVSGSIDASSFATKVDFATGTFPYCVAIGDVDGDGKPDLLVVNVSVNTVSVFRNTSTSGSINASSFAQKVDFATGNAPRNVAIGDVDGDGKPDLVVTNQDGNTVSVLRNTSTSGSITAGSFAPKVDFTTGSLPWCVAIGDLNGDGKPDLAVANASGSTVSVFQNAAGSMAAPTLSSPVDGSTGVSASPTLSWNAVSGATSYRVQLSGSASFSSVLIDQSGITGTSYPVSGLAVNTLYYWRVSATSSSSTSSYSTAWSFTTGAVVPSVTTLNPTAVSATSLTLSGTVNPNGSSSTAWFEWGTTSGLTSYTSTSSQSIGAGGSAVTVSASITSLVSNTVHYFRVVGQNSAGTARGTIISATTSGQLVTPTPVSPTNAATNQQTSLTLSWSSTTAATYHVQVGLVSDFSSQLIVDDSSLTTNSKQLTGLAENCTYYWRVHAKYAAGSSLWSPGNSFSTITSKTMISPGIPFISNPTQSTDYRLVSFPGTTVFLLSQIMSGTQNTDWRMFRDNGGSVPNNLTELSSTSSTSVGEGYWLLTKGTFNFSRTVTPASLSSDGSYTLSVRAGWNIIGNPFDVSVSWATVKQDNGLSSSLWAYAGTSLFQSSATLEPFKGYYVNCSSTSLRIRYPFPSMKQAEVLPPAIDWKLQLALETPSTSDEENYVGIAPSAREDRDNLDQLKPPLIFDQTYLFIASASQGAQAQFLSSDFRPAIGGGQVWNLVISNPRLSRCKLRILGVDKVPSEFAVSLVDEHNTRPIDLRLNSELSFQMNSDRMLFHVIVGGKEFVEEQVSKYVPAAVELSQNYPNPFNPSTSITYKIPRIASVKVEIVSMLGQHIETIAEGSHAPGVYTVVWNAAGSRENPASSGIYFSRLIVDGKVVQVRKMALLR